MLVILSHSAMTEKPAAFLAGLELGTSGSPRRLATHSATSPILLSLSQSFVWRWHSVMILLQARMTSHTLSYVTCLTKPFYFYSRSITEFGLPVISRLPGVLLLLSPSLKPREDHRQATNYHLISLTSCLCKVMEKMVNGRLMWYLEKNYLLSPVQYRFRKLRSTAVREAFSNNQHHVTVFFDLEKVYDTAWRHGILQSLFEFGLRGH